MAANLRDFIITLRSMLQRNKITEEKKSRVNCVRIDHPSWSRQNMVFRQEDQHQ